LFLAEVYILKQLLQCSRCMVSQHMMYVHVSGTIHLHLADMGCMAKKLSCRHSQPVAADRALAAWHKTCGVVHWCEQKLGPVES
jgi:hypothetical protein